MPTNAVAASRHQGEDFDIAIIGVGPRGTYCFSSLMTELRRKPLRNRLNIHLIEPDEFGPGHVYATTQPEYLHLNTIAGQVTAYSDASVDGAAPPSLAPNLCEWLNANGEPCAPHDYPSRAQHGRYLAAAFRGAIATAPPGVFPVLHSTFAHDIIDLGGSYLITLGNNTDIVVDKVLITTGHSLHHSAAYTHLNRFAEGQRRSGNSKIAFIECPYPIADKIVSLPAGVSLGIIGLGLTALDVISGATEGKGGSYARESNGNLRYCASGKEPRIAAWSRTGIPLAARAKNQKAINFKTPASFLTPQRIEEFRKDAFRLRGNSQIDYHTQLFPAIIREMKEIYAKTLATDCQTGGSMRASSEGACSGIIPTDLDKFDWQKAAAPFHNASFASENDFRNALLNHIDDDLSEAKKGNVSSAWKAASDMLRDIRDVIRSAVDFGGLTPASHRQFCERFSPINNRISVGPPAIKIEQLKALTEAGILDIFLGPNPTLTVNSNRGCFDVTPTAFDGTTRHLEVVVNAVLPTPDCRTSTSSLIQNLLKRGTIRPFVNRSREEEYVPGGIDINTEGQVILRVGRAHPDISAAGVLTEGAVLYTTVAARPGVNSRSLRDSVRWARRVREELASKEDTHEALMRLCGSIVGS